MKKFTLIELLVVVAIMGILSSMLIPSLQKARKAAEMAVCASNQKQIVTGAMIVSTDTELLPNAAVWGQQNETWMYTISIYMDTPADKNTVSRELFSDVFFCPSANEANYYGYNQWAGFPGRLNNSNLGDQDYYESVRITKVSAPESAWFTGDNTYWLHNRGYFSTTTAQRHKNRVQGVTLDGAIKLLRDPQQGTLHPDSTMYWINWAFGSGQ